MCYMYHFTIISLTQLFSKVNVFINLLNNKKLYIAHPYDEATGTCMRVRQVRVGRVFYHVNCPGCLWSRAKPPSSPLALVQRLFIAPTLFGGFDG